jgi:hypothetical protein
LTTARSRAYTEHMVSSPDEQAVLECIHTVQKDGPGYGQVIVTIKAGRIVTVRREHITQLREPNR